MPASAQEPPDFLDSGQPITILSPLPDSIVSAGEPLEISMLLEGFSGLDLRLLLDSADVTSNAEMSSEYVFCLVDSALAAGPHTALFLALSGADTVFAKSWRFAMAPSVAAPDTLADLFPEEGIPKIPFDFSATVGAQYGICGQDTAGLGLSYPVSAYPTAELNASGPLAGGSFNGCLGYDPSYDRYPHGLLQMNAAGMDLSLGEFYPTISELAFSGVTPLGGLLAYQFPGVKVELTGCRTQSADTGFQTFSQFLYGGQVTVDPMDSLRVFAGCLAGFDRAASLPDSVRYKRTVFVYTDTLMGITDSLVTIDSLHPGKNRIWWAGAGYAVRHVAVRMEYAASSFLPDTGGAVSDRAVSLSVHLRFGGHGAEIGFTSFGGGFKSFGNPYLETSKDEFSFTQESRWSERFSTSVDGAVYKVYDDSTGGNSGRLGIGMSFSRGWLAGSSLRFDYSLRPFSAYLSQTRTAAASFSVKAGRVRIAPSYSYSSASSDRRTQSHSVAVELWSRVRYNAQLKFGAQYYQLRDDWGSSDQDKSTPYVKTTWDVGRKNSFDFTVKYISKNDRIDPAKSYRQTLLAGEFTHRF
ncbi:MAG: hypothetical protein QME74_03495 [Candidatus Edwardsbacteria bacterium]|nr:hypothetical protein [Candidatus Edwardsbacteria bacterium]